MTSQLILVRLDSYHLVAMEIYIYSAFRRLLASLDSWEPTLLTSQLVRQGHRVRG